MADQITEVEEVGELGNGVSSGLSGGLDEESGAAPVGSLIGATTVALHGLCDTRLVDFAEWPDFFDDMRVDIEKECKRHGDVVRVCINESVALSSAFVCFGVPAQAEACQTAMDQRFFAGRLVSAKIHSDEIWAA